MLLKLDFIHLGSSSAKKLLLEQMFISTKLVQNPNLTKPIQIYMSLTPKNQITIKNPLTFW